VRLEHRDHHDHQRRISISAVLVIYSATGLGAWLLTWWLTDYSPFFYPDTTPRPLPEILGHGAGAGLLVVLLSRLLERYFAWARALARRMIDLIGPLDGPSILVISLSSAIGEEMLFRGFLQPSIGLIASSLLFGLLHIGPNRAYWPWTVMAIAMGFAFGALYLFTGTLLAPILAHFTINFFNLHHMMAQKPHPGGS